MTNMQATLPEPERIRYLDGWRGFAILAVIFAHFFTAKHINLGRFGVELFFVLSGRLMAEILFVRNSSLTKFFPRRVSRVYPALFVYLTVMFGMNLVLNIGDMTVNGYVASVLFLFNYTQIWMGRPGVLGHIWSLCIEEHIYIVLGLTAFIHRRWPLPINRLILLFIVVSVTIGAVQTGLGMNYYHVYWRTDVRGASILIGVLAYLTMDKIALDKVPSWVPLVCGGLALVLSFDVVPDPIKYSIGTAFLATSLVLMRSAPKFALAVLEHPLILRVGIWSYSMYLWQQPFGKLAAGTSGRLMSLPLVLLATVLSYYLVEKPARRAINNLVDRWRSSRNEEVSSSASVAR